MTRARKNSIIVNTSKISGKGVDLTGLTDGSSLKYDLATDSFVPEKFAEEVHDHEIGDITLIFDNKLI
jgi:hypothetical protein